MVIPDAGKEKKNKKKRAHTHIFKLCALVHCAYLDVAALVSLSSEQKQKHTGKRKQREKRTNE